MTDWRRDAACLCDFLEFLYVKLWLSYLCHCDEYIASAPNGNLEVPVCLLKEKQGYAVRKMETDKWI
jgi:hypothetical protein